MIEINLLPGSTKRTRRKVGLSAGPLAKIKMPQMDRILAISIAMTVAGVALIAWMQISGSSRLKAVTFEEQLLIRDTASLSAEIAQNAALNAKQDTIVRKLTVIQELDGGRYNWAHILDEISRATPDYTWLISITPSDAAAIGPSFRIEGRMGNAFALPKFIQDLEASPFIANVALRGSDPVVENNKALYSFSVEAQFEEPPVDMIRTEPLFAPDMQNDLDAAASTPPGTPAAPAATPANQPATPPAGAPPAAAKPAGRQ